MQPFVGGSVTIPRDPKVFVRTLQAQFHNVVLAIWSNPTFCRYSPSLVTFVVSIITHVYTTIGDVKGSRIVFLEELVNDLDVIHLMSHPFL